MALFQGAVRVPNSRSHTRLVVSDGFSPAEKWITDPTLPRLFEYSYGGPGYVVIPKGTIVSIGAQAKDFETGKMINTFTIADPGAARGTAKMPMGVAPYNIYEKIDDRFGGNQPALITRDYIEVPYMGTVADVYTGSVVGLDTMKMRWGCAYGAGLAAGDFVTSDACGKFVKLTIGAASDIPKIVGRVYAVETDLPPTGWLKYLDWATETGERADDQNKVPLVGGEYPYSPAYKWPLTPDFRGIPGQTDGEAIGRKTVAAEAVGNITTGAKAGTVFAFKLAKGPLYAGEAVHVHVAGVDATGTVQVDYESGIVYYTIDATDETTVAGAPAAVTIGYDYHDLSYLGVPAAWDFAGSVGAVRILLTF